MDGLLDIAQVVLVALEKCPLAAPLASGNRAFFQAARFAGVTIHQATAIEARTANHQPATDPSKTVSVASLSNASTTPLSMNKSAASA